MKEVTGGVVQKYSNMSLDDAIKLKRTEQKKTRPPRPAPKRTGGGAHIKKAGNVQQDAHHREGPRPVITLKRVQNSLSEELK